MSIQQESIVSELFPITGLSCASCASSAEKVLNHQPGVRKAKVNFASGTAFVEYEEVSTRPERLKEALQKVGYELITNTSNDENDLYAGLLNQKEVSVYRMPALVSMVFFVPLFVVGMFAMHEGWSPYAMLLLTLPIVIYGGKTFFITAYRLALQRTANMDTLVAVSTAISLVFSIFNTFYPNYWLQKGFTAEYYYEAAGGVIAFVLLGKWLEDRAKAKTKDSIRGLMQLTPSNVTLIFDDRTTAEVPLNQVQVGNQLLIKANERIPVDGAVIEGSVWIDQSSLTGEPIPVEKNAGDKVYSGTLNGGVSFILQAEKVGKDTLLAGIVRSVYEALSTKAPVQRWADQVSAWFTPAMVAISILTLVGWGIFGGESGWVLGLLHAATVMVIACPCALGLATPTALMVAMGRAAQNGILIKDAESLEKASQITDVFLDKTGTLTAGKPEVLSEEWFYPQDEMTSNILFSIEKQSDHPLAQAIVRRYQGQAKEIPLASTENRLGKGMVAHLGNDTYSIGNAKLMTEAGITVPQQTTDETLVYVAKNQTLLAILTIADRIRPESTLAIAELHANGIQTHLLTGDTMPTAQKVAQTVGITNVHAGLLPQDKLDFIRQYKSAGKVTAMVGDGLNDSSALAQADVSIAMGSGSEVAMSVASMTLVQNDLRKLRQALRLSQITVRVIRQNLFWAFIYNVVSIPVAAGLLYPFTHFSLNPMWAGLAMALSSFSVVMNSLRLKMIKI